MCPAHPKSFACTLSNYNARTHNVLFSRPVQVSQISCIRLAKGLLSVLYQLFHYIQLFLFYTITRKSAYICERNVSECQLVQKGESINSLGHVLSRRRFLFYSVCIYTRCIFCKLCSTQPNYKALPKQLLSFTWPF